MYTYLTRYTNSAIIKNMEGNQMDLIQVAANTAMKAAAEYIHKNGLGYEISQSRDRFGPQSLDETKRIDSDYDERYQEE